MVSPSLASAASFPKAPKQAPLSIDFLIIGAGVAGLTCAFALRRVGHRVVVIEREKEIGESNLSRAVQLPPNLSKILYHWNLKPGLSFAIKSKAIQISRYETGVRLGNHQWNEELADLRKMLYDVAVGQGADIRLDTTAVAVDPQRRAVTLDSGNTLTADVIIGAEGVSGLVRPLLLAEQNIREASEPSLCMYSAVIPRALVEADPQCKEFYEPEAITMFSYFGNNQSVVSHPTGGSDAFALTLYRPLDKYEESPVAGMRAALKDAEPRLKNLGSLMLTPRRFPIFEYSPLENWVDTKGRVVVIGGAAHPIPPGSTQYYAMDVEDGAVLAKLFSHLHTHDQISEFLYAFQDLRQPRTETVLAAETGIIHFMSMPYCAKQEKRDQEMMAKVAMGADVFDISAGGMKSPEWREIKEVFGYDAEDEADNWWVTWGLLKQRSLGSSIGSSLTLVETTRF
ncbi:hypothetical protein B0H11DRAFT_1953873 [Mycena galericulata]|nr:hypothetical protein B0H11DRAFT_1953873 [Mycena galericulata]